MSSSCNLAAATAHTSTWRSPAADPQECVVTNLHFNFATTGILNISEISFLEVSQLLHCRITIMKDVINIWLSDKAVYFMTEPLNPDQVQICFALSRFVPALQSFSFIAIATKKIMQHY
jgi:hypothetical protein